MRASEQKPPLIGLLLISHFRIVGLSLLRWSIDQDYVFQTSGRISRSIWPNDHFCRLFGLKRGDLSRREEKKTLKKLIQPQEVFFSFPPFVPVVVSLFVFGVEERKDKNKTRRCVLSSLHTHA